MTTEYERQRLLNISNNKELLNSLALAKPKPKRYGRPASGAPSRPAKRERLDPAPSTRASARLSTQPKPSYAEDNTPFQSLPIQRKKATTTAASRAPPLSEEEVQEIIQRWDWEATAPAPERSEIGTLHFSDHPDFTPNLTPEEILRQGAFGGSYYRPVYSQTLSITIPPDYSDLAPSWLNDLPPSTYLISPTPNPRTNKFRVLCGQSIEEWEASGWINHTNDPRGWFQWYTRFHQGRRCDDDERQIGRWKRCVGEKGRWKRVLLKRYIERGIREVGTDDSEEVSPVVHQTCHHWGYQVTQEDLDEAWRG